MYIEGLLEWFAGLVDPMEVSSNLKYGTVDGGSFDNSAVTGSVLGLQQKYPDATSGKSILAFDSLKTDIPKLMGAVEEPATGSLVFENVYDAPDFSYTVGEA